MSGAGGWVPLGGTRDEQRTIRKVGGSCGDGSQEDGSQEDDRTDGWEQGGERRPEERAERPG